MRRSRQVAQTCLSSVAVEKRTSRLCVHVSCPRGAAAADDPFRTLLDAAAGSQLGDPIGPQYVRHVSDPAALRDARGTVRD